MDRLLFAPDELLELDVLELELLELELLALDDDELLEELDELEELLELEAPGKSTAPPHPVSTANTAAKGINLVMIIYPIIRWHAPYPESDGMSRSARHGAPKVGQGPKGW